MWQRFVDSDGAKRIMYLRMRIGPHRISPRHWLLVVVCSLPSLLWVVRESLFGHVTSYKLFKALYKMKNLSYRNRGFRHDIRLSERYSTCSIGGVRANSPYDIMALPPMLWGLICDKIEQDLTGKSVVDIGAADGYFSLEAAKSGALVTAIQPSHTFVDCLNVMVEYLGLRERVDVITGYYPSAGRDAVLNANIVLCLGLVYHLNNLIEGLQPMVRSKAILVIEGTFLDHNSELDETTGYARGFDPERHCNGGGICSRWLCDYLTQHEFDYHWLGDWERWVMENGGLNGPGIRRALIATHSSAPRAS